MGIRAQNRKRMADLVHRHDLYEAAVQDPASEAGFVDQAYRELRGRSASTLREDFCGTAVFALEWVRLGPERRAIGVDLDGPTLEWGLEHRIRPAGEALASRVDLVRQNVMDAGNEPVDITVAFNFSYWIFKERATLLRYFRVAREGLRAGGLFFLDCFGGSESSEVNIDDRIIDAEPGWGFDEYVYEWDQASYDPRSAEIQCNIHFEFPDRSRIHKAFSYDWRQWTLPELGDLLLEAGFTAVHFYWEVEDEDGEGTGDFHRPETTPDHEGQWWVYIVAER